jgi:Fibronectin type III domain
MKRYISMLSVFLAALLAPGLGTAAPQGKPGTQVPFEAVKIIIEFNSTAQDAGVQLFFDAEAWKSVTVIDPDGHRVFQVDGKGSLKRLGGSELFVESDEPELQEVPLEDLFAQFPEGEYRFIGTSPDGESLASTAKFTHKIPDGPSIVSPGTLDPDNAVISWAPVTTPPGIQIAGYEVVIEHDEFHVFDVKVPGSTTDVTVPPQFLEPGTEYGFEVLAIAKGGNQTITESSFVTE